MPLNLRGGEVIRVGNDRQEAQEQIAAVVHAQPNGLDALVGQRRPEIALTFVVGQHCSANGHRALLANLGTGHEGLLCR